MSEKDKEQTLEEMQLRASAAYAKQAGLPGEAAISATLITTIITIALGLLKSCGSTAPAGIPGAAAIKARATRPGALQRLRVRREVVETLRNEYGAGGFYQHNGPAVVETILAMGAGATEEEIYRAMSIES